MDGAFPSRDYRLLPLGAASMRERILLADDEPSMRWAIARHLTRRGYRVQDATCGEDALRLLESGATFDLLVTDVMMLAMNGIELADAARRIVPEIGVILMSGAVDDASGSGYRFLTKPFDVRVLLSNIREILDDPRSGPAHDGEASGDGVRTPSK